MVYLEKNYNYYRRTPHQKKITTNIGETQTKKITSNIGETQTKKITTNIAETQTKKLQLI